ncbi:MAG: D-alanyl-D-alanine carboxypeptidase family protein [Oscillospiraceae bacterium]
MKKLFSIVFVLIICISFSLTAFAAGFTPPFEITAASAYMVNLDTGLVLYEKNPDEKRSVASLTKLMTSLLFMEAVPPEAMDSTIIYADPGLYVYPVVGGGGSTADIRPYEQVTARSLLYAMLLPSGNEAAAIAAFHVGNGNLENFYAMMNARAAQLGCKNTNFTNPHGLEGMEKNNYSTARDLFLIAQQCWTHELFKAVVGSNSYEMPFTNKHPTAEFASKPNSAYTIYTTNLMQSSKTAGIHRDYIKGIKTGSTENAGRNFISTATENGMTYLNVVLGCPWDPPEDGYAYSFHDTADLCDWAFKNFEVRPALDPLSAINEIKVKYSRETDILRLFPAEEMKTILPKESDETVLQKKYMLPKSVNAPIKQGDIIGKVTLSLAGEVIGTVDLLAGEDVHRNTVLFIISKTTDFLKSTYFRVVMVVSVITLLGYVSVAVVQHNRHKKTKPVFDNKNRK